MLLLWPQMCSSGGRDPHSECPSPCVMPNYSYDFLGAREEVLKQDSHSDCPTPLVIPNNYCNILGAREVLKCENSTWTHNLYHLLMIAIVICLPRATSWSFSMICAAVATVWLNFALFVSVAAGRMKNGKGSSFKLLSRTNKVKEVLSNFLPKKQGKFLHFLCILPDLRHPWFPLKIVLLVTGSPTCRYYGITDRWWSKCINAARSHTHSVFSC